ncbi:MAG: hypothetical protein AAFN77_23140 [Planctomycetota bacterium]
MSEQDSMESGFSPEQQVQYTALTESVGSVELSNWTMLEMRGDDRHSFLSGFCTAEIKSLKVGEVTEAFVLNGKGKILGHLHVANLSDRMLLVGPGEQAASVSEHLDRYLIREKVEIVDRSAETSFVLLVGPSADGVIESAFGESVVTEKACEVSDSIVSIESEFAGTARLLCVASNQLASVTEVLSEHGVVSCDAAVLEPIRLQAGTPWFGVEVDETNLPQEVDRDDKAISFTKGCYLGQETVARIDSLGRVNRLLRIARVTGPSPQVGSSVFVEDKDAGTVKATSAVPGRSDGICTLMVKRAYAKTGQVLQSGDAELTIVEALS